ncbi:N/A [soil metagenome]
MTSKATKVRVGAFLAVTAALLAVVIIVFGGMRFWEKKATYRILFDDTVMGLEAGASVFLNGIKIGRVDNIEIAPDDLSKVEVTIVVKRKAPIHTDTVALLSYAGITGLKIIDLRKGTLKAPLLADGGTIPQGEGLLDKMAKKAEVIADQSEQLMKKANQIVENLVAITGPKQFEGISDIVQSSKVAAANLAQATGSLKEMIGENRVALKETLVAVKGAVGSTQKIIDSQISGIVGSAGELIGDIKSIVRGTRGPMDSAMFDLRQASRNFKELSRDLRQRPSRLLFSRPPGERKLP